MTRSLLLAVLVAAACKDPAPKEEPKSSAAKSAPGAAAAAPPGAEPATATKRPASVTDDHVATADKMIATLTELGTKIEKAANCAEMTRTLESSMPAFAAIQPAMAKTAAETDADPAASAWFEANYKGRMQEAAMPFLTRAATCKDDPAFMTAMSQMPMMKKKQKQKQP